MPTDRERIEDALIPAIFLTIIHSHIKHQPEAKESYKIAIEITNEVISNAIKGEVRLFRRLDRIVSKINKYFLQNQFDTRKRFLTISAWAGALIDAGGLIVQSGLNTMLEDMREVIKKGYQEIENFAVIDASAIKHVDRIHKIAQEEGYF